MIDRIVFRLLALILLAGAGLSCSASGPRPDSDGVQVIFLSEDRGEPPASQNRPLYYKIFINEKLIARTASGLPGEAKSASVRLRPGTYWFYAERWSLQASEGSGEYQRANNIWQMRTHLELVIPKNRRQVVVGFGFDHRARKFTWSVTGE